MKISLRELKVCERGLQKLVNAELPARVSFRLTIILKTVRESLQSLEKIRSDLIAKYGYQHDDGICRIEKDSENEKKFKEEFELLLDETVELTNYTRLTLEDIADAHISAVELEPLIGNFIKSL